MAMTVAELIAELQKMPQDWTAVTGWWGSERISDVAATTVDEDPFGLPHGCVRQYPVVFVG